MEKYPKFEIKQSYSRVKKSLIGDIIPKAINTSFYSNLKVLYNNLKDNLKKEHKCKIRFYNGSVKKMDKAPYIRLELFNNGGNSWYIYLSHIYLDEGLFIKARFGFNNKCIIFRNILIMEYDLLEILRGFIDDAIAEWSYGMAERFNDNVYFGDESKLYEKLFDRGKIGIYKHDLNYGCLHPDHIISANILNNNKKGTHI